MISLKEIHKIFPDGTHALKGVSLDLRPGEVLALLGENGAGKTTLMKILSGIYEPTAGVIEIGGRAIRFKSARDALNMGIAMVHQHLSLIDELTPLENVALYMGPSLRGIDKNLERGVRAIAESLGFEIDWARPVGELPLGVRQRIEIVKALYLGARVLILDEPTSLLSPPEVKQLIDTVKTLRSQGRTIVFITHKIPEALAVADRVVVLRRGEKVGEYSPDTSPETLVEAMVGRRYAWALERSGGPGDVVLSVEDLWVYERGRPLLQGVSLSVRRQEIHALVGVEGNGQETLVDVIVGLREPARGEIRLRGKLAYIPEDRHGRALALELPLVHNAVLGLHKKFSRRGLFDWRGARGFASKLIEEFSIVAPGPDAVAKSLSGGNQQKLVVGRELSKGADLIVAHQPTRGLDVMTTDYVHKLLMDARNAGSGVLLISSDLDEALKLADRVSVIYRGRIVLTKPLGETSVDEIGRAMAGL
ncbi:ABC transporter ATP-binding protein [Thermoproteus tenax]|uniref:Sugar transport ATP-binding protein n=1 Tax=Thermoproteus tenax (strain ATCC 35583 / DSM 2078 / JCM 9277 / NBRC 100435 / Kra 1) TaxID=768679 RepID=G4RJL7_THETK|nr:ABC transporter ATP-binding protein [Thermoproteus tenax]CCC81762.1 sugar transport ATP-binding protein [Thermoproteus tenax Kra 1]